MLTAVEHLGSVGVGVTSPQFFRAADNNIYIVKLQNNRLGPKVLVNEWIAAKIGAIMELCFPPSDIITINGQQHFASQYLEHGEYVGKHNLYKVTNIKEMAGIMLFDHIFHNADRTNNRKNLLICQETDGFKIYAIDNSHLFRSGLWTIESLNGLSQKIKTYYRYSFGLLLRDCLSPQDFLPYLEKIITMTKREIEEIVAEIPQEWLTDPNERQALLSYIKLRQSMVEEIWKILCNYIPKARGGKRCLWKKR